MSLRPILALVLAFSLTACATLSRYDAAGDIHAFLVSIRDNDQAAFDRYVDRPALKAHLRATLTAEAIRRSGALGGAAAQVLGGLVEPLVDVAVQPEVFLAIAEAHGYTPSQPIPGRTVIASAIRPLQDDRVCVVTKRGGPCVLVFRMEGGAWRLVAFEGTLDQLRLPRSRPISPAAAR